ncbi:MAG: hypothetical protein ACRDQH_14005 [Pseudonocardiaceae bacterium]
MTVVSSGEHWHRVPLAEVGGGIRSHGCDDTAVLDGSSLIPWPHQLADGATGVTGLAAALSPWRRR